MKITQYSQELYTDVIKPSNSKDLVVHNKKIAEIKFWLKSTKERCDPQVLLLTGPTGSGKSTTVQVLAKELAIDLISFEPEKLFDDDMKMNNNDVDDFCRFLRRSGARFKGSENRRTSILYVTELPDKAFSDVHSFRHTLSHALSDLQLSLIFCLSDVPSSWYHHPARIFTHQFNQNNYIQTAKFNAVAVTFIKKALKNACEQLSIPISTSQMSEIVAEANGDLRLALNMLQFNSISSKKSKSAMDPLISAKANREETFHMLGRILHAKRVPQTTKKNYRPKLEHDVNDIIKMSSMAGEKVVAFLHEHEVRFLEDVSLLRKVSEVFSFCDALTGDWSSRMAFNEEYLSQIAARNVMWYNYEKKKTEWRSLNGPKMAELEKEIEVSRKELARTSGIGDTQRNILTIPYEAMMKKTEDPENIKQYLCRPMIIPWNMGRDAIYAQLDTRNNIFQKPKNHHRPAKMMKMSNEVESDEGDDEEIIIEDSDNDDSFDD